jgi:hypothetical protein
LIANPDFSQAGATPGQAAGWTLRSVCARASIAAFAGAPAEPVEGFERWSSWSGALGTATFASFAANEAAEAFDRWPDPLFAFELTEGLVQARAQDGFDAGWWTGAAHFAWSDVSAPPVVFTGGASLDTFGGWRPGDVYLFAFADAALTRAVFHGEASEIFDAWTTKNTTI